MKTSDKDMAIQSSLHYIIIEIKIEEIQYRV